MPGAEVKKENRPTGTPSPPLISIAVEISQIFMVEKIPEGKREASYRHAQAGIREGKDLGVVLWQRAQGVGGGNTDKRSGRGKRRKAFEG